MTQVLQIAVRRDAGATILLQVPEQLRGVDSGNQSAIGGQRAPDQSESGAPAAVARQEQCKVLHGAGRAEDLYAFEAAMRKGFGSGTANLCDEDDRQEAQQK